jgi:hypothetical protein
VSLRWRIPSEQERGRATTPPREEPVVVWEMRHRQTGDGLLCKRFDKCERVVPEMLEIKEGTWNSPADGFYVKGRWFKGKYRMRMW